MKDSYPPHNRRHPFQKGFGALIAVMLLSIGTLAMSLATLSAVVSYADMVRSREIRIQNNLNRRACEDTIHLMIAQDFFLTGEVVLPEFGCKASVTNDRNGTVLIFL